MEFDKYDRGIQNTQSINRSLADSRRSQLEN